MRRTLYPSLLVALVWALVSCATSGGLPRSGGAGATPPSGSVVPFATAVPSATPTASPTAVPAHPPTVAPEIVPTAPPAFCPVARPPDPPFVPPAPVTLFAGSVWHGTAALWTQPPRDGTWQGYTQKVLWWRQGYDCRGEPQPDLAVIGRRLDAPAPPLVASLATNAYNAADIGSAMLVGVRIPTSGCWEITGRYGGTTLSFVVWVAP